MHRKFQQIIQSNKPVLVDFFADWCVPCRQVPPVLKEVKQELKEQVRIIKVNVDRNPVIASKYQIRNLPTMMLFVGGEMKWSGSGLYSAESIIKEISKYLTD